MVGKFIKFQHHESKRYISTATSSRLHVWKKGIATSAFKVLDSMQVNVRATDEGLLLDEDIEESGHMVSQHCSDMQELRNSGRFP
jgi:hypothetical protein